MVKTPSENMAADIFTKAFPEEKAIIWNRCLSLINIHPRPSSSHPLAQLNKNGGGGVVDVAAPAKQAKSTMYNDFWSNDGRISMRVHLQEATIVPSNWV